MKAICLPLLLFWSLATVMSQTPDWKLVWSDEFDGPTLNEQNWRYSDGGGGWGNGELEQYTHLPENVRIEDGTLVIEALKTATGYTSARINSRTKFLFTYGRVEARMKFTHTQGSWPALWLLGDANGKSWPSCGEIDLMENIGKEPNTIHATVHGPGYSGKKGITKAYESPTSLEDWHVLVLEWEPAAIRWSWDGVLFQTLTPAMLPPKSRWVFDHDYYFIVNLAVGGGWPDYPDPTSVFPQRFTLDYLRVYQKAE